MAAPARTRSRSRATSRRPAYRAERGAPSSKTLLLGTVAVIALVIGGLVGAWALRPASPKARMIGNANSVGTPAAEVALPTEENPGPMRRSGIVPSGFTNGSTGAVAAAAAFTETGVNLTTKPDSDVRSTLRRMVGADAPASVEAITSLRKVLNARPDSVLRVVPLGRRIDPKSTEVRQTVDVWVAVITATPSGIQTPDGVVPAPTEAVYLTVSVDVARTGGDWRMQALRFVEGPTPAASNNAPTDAERFARDLKSYQPYTYLPPKA